MKAILFFLLAYVPFQISAENKHQNISEHTYNACLNLNRGYEFTLRENYAAAVPFLEKAILELNQSEDLVILPLYIYSIALWGVCLEQLDQLDMFYKYVGQLSCDFLNQILIDCDALKSKFDKYAECEDEDALDAIDQILDVDDEGLAYLASKTKHPILKTILTYESDDDDEE